MKRNRRNRTPQDWQHDPSNVQTNRVQFWRGGVMVTAQMTREAAQEAVREGNAFVMTGQAVGAMQEGQMNS